MRVSKTITPLSLSALLALGLGIACSKPKPAPEPPPAPAPVVAPEPTQAPVVPAGPTAEELAQQRRDAEMKQYSADKAAALKNIHFDFDKSDIKEDDRPTLQGIADFMKKYSDVKIQVAGNCDERGTNEYNLALGNRRAAAALDYLKGLGVDGARVSTISYGKEKPLCTESNEACWSQNRRDEFTAASEHVAQ